MCYPPSARPPDVPADLLAPIAGGAGGHSAVVTSEDGARFGAYVASAGDGESGIVICPDVRGLHAFYEELAERFAAAGVHAIAFDWFGRSAGVGRRGEDFPYRDHVPRTTSATEQSDLAAAIGHLRGATRARRIYVTGFCKGGRAAFNASAEQHGLSGVIGFYGWPVARSDDDAAAPIAKVDRMRAPVLGIFGGADQGIPPQAIERFERALAERFVSHHLVTYPDAPHSFFDRTAAEHRDASEDAWRRLLGFVRTGDPTARA